MIEVISNTITKKDLHIILTYRNPVEPETVKKDILTYLLKLRKYITNDFEYCYTVNPITDKHPAVHILLRGKIQIKSNLLKYWNKGLAKSTEVTHVDRRSMDYYLTRWGGKVHHSRGLV